MINFNDKLTHTDAIWVLENVFPVFGYRIDNSTLTTLMQGHNKVFLEQVGVPSCSCEYMATHKVWTSRLEQYRAQIEAVAYPPLTMEPSVIINEAITEIQMLPNEIRVTTKRGRKPKTV